MEPIDHSIYRHQALAFLRDSVPVFLSAEDITRHNVDAVFRENPFWNSSSKIIALMNSRRISCTVQLVRETGATKPKILDLACGQGIVTAEIRKQFPLAEVYGLDISQQAIEVADKASSGVAFCVGNAMGMPYRDSLFDIVICNNFWEHVENPVALTREASRVLKDDGVLILSTPNRYRFLNLWRLLRGRKVELLNNKLHVTEYSIGQIEEILRYSGMRMQRVLSKKMRRGDLTFKTKLATITVQQIIAAYISLVKSHHVLEDTIFISAKKA